MHSLWWTPGIKEQRAESRTGFLESRAREHGAQPANPRKLGAEASRKTEQKPDDLREKTPRDMQPGGAHTAAMQHPLARRPEIHLIGAFLIWVCVGLEAFREVYLASALQQIPVYELLFILSALVTAVGLFAAALRSPGDFNLLRRHGRDALLMSALNAAAWAPYLYALKVLPPSIANTLQVGIGPVAILVLARLGLDPSAFSSAKPKDLLAQAAIVSCLLYLCLVVTLGLSGIGQQPLGDVLPALMLSVLSGVAIMASMLYSKRLMLAGVSASGVLSARFALVIVVALIGLPGGLGDAERILSDARYIEPAMIIVAVIILPVFLYQHAFAVTNALTAGVIGSFGPAAIFLVQSFEGRLSFSGWALIGVLAYCALSALSNALRDYRIR